MCVPGRLSLGVLVRTMVSKLFGGLFPLRGVAFLYVSIFCLLPIASAQQADQVRGDQAASDQATAARVLGAQWKQMSRRAGIIFTGTGLAGDLPVSQKDKFIS